MPRRRAHHMNENSDDRFVIAMRHIPRSVPVNSYQTVAIVYYYFAREITYRRGGAELGHGLGPRLGRAIQAG